MYIKITYSNGFCGCDEYDYVEVADAKDADEYLKDGLQMYGFIEPDDRFVNMDDEEELEWYNDECYDNSYWEEITKEEYEENR